MDDKTAIERVKAGDASAFESVVRRYQGPIYNLMYRAAGDGETAADLTQEAFLRAFRHLSGFDPARRLFPWLYALGMNLARDHLRRQQAAPAMETGSDVNEHGGPVSGPELSLIRKADAAAVNDALAAIGIEHREALILRFKEEMSLQEVADALEISLSAAKMRISRGVARIRQILSDNGHGPGE